MCEEPGRFSRATTNRSGPGRYLSLMPFSDGCGSSRKIEAPKERTRLRPTLNGLPIPESLGVIVRTARRRREKSLRRPPPSSPQRRQGIRPPRPHAPGDP
ncbi:MAG: ribonuclease E/G [Opitutae bacterium]|nr:ribonuclease E/G [Opitutae bacterium]